MKNAATVILAISASLAPKSRSRSMARVAVDSLARFEGVEGRWLDLAEFDLRSYPRSENDPVVSRMREEFEAADGFIIACPVYNWGAASSLTNCLHYLLDPEGGRRYRPFVVLGGAGSSRSHLALDGVARSLLYEIQGVQIGPPLLGAGAKVDGDRGWLEPELVGRIEKLSELLVRHASIYSGQRVPSAA